MAEMQRCRSCRRLIRADDHFCPLCGSEQFHGFFRGAPPTPPSRRRGTLLLLGLIALIIAAILLQQYQASRRTVSPPSSFRSGLARLAPDVPRGGPAPAFSVGSQAVVTGRGTGLYAAPGDYTHILVVVPPGTKLTIMGSATFLDGTEWWLVRDDQGLQGYVFGQNIVPIDSGHSIMTAQTVAGAGWDASAEVRRTGTPLLESPMRG